MNYDQVIAELIMKEKTPEERRAVAEKFRKDMPQCTVPTEELTRRIRQVVPEYHFEEGSQEEVEKRKALSESAHNSIVDYDLELKEADFCQMGEKVFTGQQRTQGQNLAGYIHHFMPKEYEDELRRLSELKPGDEGYDKFSEDEAKLRAAIFRHAAEHADEIFNDIKNMDTENLLRSYSKIMHLGNIADVLRYLGDHNKNEEVMPREEYQQIFDKLVPLQEVISDYLYPVQCMAYPVGHMVDWKQVLNMSPDQQQAIADITRDIYTPYPNDSNNLWAKKNINPDIFDEVELYSNTKRNNFIEKAIGDDKKQVIAQDILGNPIDLEGVAEETMKKHRPVYLMSKNHPERPPVLGIIHEGKFYYGEDAKIKFSQLSLKKGLPNPPDERRKPTGFAGWWDRFCKARGWERLRTQSAKRYEADVKAYEDTCAAITRENKENEPFIKVQNNLNEHELTSSAKLASVREKMIRDTFNMSVEEYQEDLTKQREEAKRIAEEKAKEEAAKAEAEAKEKGKKVAQNDYNKSRKKQIDDMFAAVKFPDKDKADKAAAKKIKNNFEVLRVVVRNKQFSLYEANGMEKTERVAAAIFCRMVDNLIDTDLKNMAKDSTQLSKELTELLEADSIGDKLNEKIEKMQNTEELKQVAAGMSDETLQEICPVAPNVKSAVSINNVMKQLKATKDALNNREEQPTLTNGGATLTDQKSNKKQKAVIGN